MGVKIGDWAVWRPTSYGYCVGDVRRVTAQCFWSCSAWSSGDHRYDKRDLLFFGSKEAAEHLHAQLTSSMAQFDDDKGAALRRMKERDDRYIKTAFAAASAA